MCGYCMYDIVSMAMYVWVLCVCVALNDCW